MTSIMVAFHLALAKTLIQANVFAKEKLVENFNEIRKVISHQGSVTAADKEILAFLEIEEEKKS